MMTTPAVLMMMLCLNPNAAPPPANANAVAEVEANDPLAPWNGTWRGTFIAYRADGQPLYRIDVEQTYEMVKPNTQRGVFVNRYADGTTQTVHAVNLVEQGRLVCRVRPIDANGKGTGKVKQHIGHRIGPGHIIWYSDLGGGRFESFNEVVQGDRYTIHGVGVYGDKPADRHIFEAVYQRVGK